MTQSLHALTLIVRDYDEAIAFFVGTLGFDLLEETPEDLYGNRWDLIQRRASGDPWCSGHRGRRRLTGARIRRAGPPRGSARAAP
jgi:catechol 2,3-dioxygenase-like lactoylglutathione lyase family enzyme